MDPRAGDVMETHVVAVGPLDPLESVQRLFADESIHGAPVVDEQGRILGVISAADLMRAAADERDAARPSLRDTREPEAWDPALEREIVHECAEDVMTDAVVQVPPDTLVSEVARILREQQVHRVLVMDRDEILGIITTFDLLRLFERPDDA